METVVDLVLWLLLAATAFVWVIAASFGMMLLIGAVGYVAELPTLSRILNRLKNTLFWESEFDRIWQSGKTFFKIENVDRRWDPRREDEKRSYWREYGKKAGYPPDRAVFEGLKDIADTVYDHHYEVRANMAKTWRALAYCLYYAAPRIDERARYTPPEDQLPRRWRDFYEQEKAEREAREAAKKAQATEVASYRFAESAIDAAWKSLCAGSVPDELRRIWRCSGPPRKSAHAIAERAGITVKDFVFWMIVLRQHRWMNEAVVDGEQLYHNENDLLALKRDLPEDMQKLLKFLNS